MANVLGTLVVNVLGNTASFLDAMSKSSVEARKTGKEIEGTFSRLSGALSSALGPLGEIGAKVAETFEGVGEAAGHAMSKAGALGGIMAGAAAGVLGLAGALGLAAMHAAETGNKIFEVGEKTGLTSKTIQGLMAITKLTGGSFEELSSTLGRAEQNLGKGEVAGGKLNKVLVNLEGGAKGAAELGLLPVDERLRVLLQRIFALQDPTQRAAELTALLGKGWQGNVEALREWATSADAGAAAAKRFGLTMDPAKAHTLTVQINELKGQIDGLTLSIGARLLPQISDAIAGLSVWSEVWGHVGNELKDIGAIIGAVSSRDFGGLALAIADFTSQRDAIKEALAGATEAARKTAEAFTAPEGVNPALVDHTTKVNKAADAWEKHYNKVLNDTHYIIPKVVDDMKAVQLEMDRIARVQAEERQKRFVAFMTGDLSGAGLKPSMPAGALGPDFTSLEKQMTILNQTTEEAQRLNALLLQIPPAVSTALTPMQKAFRTVFFGLGEEGKNLAANLHGALQGFVSGFEDQLTHLVTTGRANFRALFRSLQEEVIHAMVAKGMASLFGALFPTTGPTTGAGGGGGLFGSLFGGFRAAGGQVNPGRAYVVGERHPEFFVPAQPGEVRPTLDVGRPNQTVVNFHVHGVQDADSFRRSSSQTLAMLQNQMALAYSRNK
jgi:hypothetical protein